MSGAGVPGPRPSAASGPPAALFVSPRRRGSLVFTILLSVAMLLGAALMALVLVTSNAPSALAVGVVLAALPVGPLLGVFLWLDRYEPEPLRLIGAAFGWGALVATAIALVLQLLGQYVLGTPQTWSAAIMAPITEEAAKGLFVLLLLWVRRDELDGILDGIVYAGIVGIGFAFTENILYLGAAYMGGGDTGPGGLGPTVGVFVVRGIFSPFAHPLFTSFIGIGVGYAVLRRSPASLLAPFLGYVLAVATHALWNGSAFFGGGQFFVLTYLFAMVPAFLLAVAFAVWVRRREAAMLTRALSDAATRGFLAPTEVPWLVRLPARRVSRQHAHRAGGRVGERVMREYQQQAVELGFLHDRYLRGSAPADVAERGTYMVQRLAALRPYVLYPSLAGAASASGAPPYRGDIVR